MGWYLSFGVGPLRYRSSKRRVYTHNGCALQHSTKAKAVACHAARDRVSAAKAARAWKREQTLAAMPPDVRAAAIRKDRRSEARINLAVWVFLLTIIGLIVWGFVTLTKPPEPQPWVGRDVYGDGKCFNNQDTPVPCPDTGWVPSGRTPR